MKWSEKFRVNSHDTDINGVVRASVILRYLQETANLQMYNLGPSNEQLRAEGRAFILSRMGISIYRPLLAYQDITVESWACESKLTSFYRCGRVYRGDEVIAELVSVWAMVNLEDRKLIRACDNESPFGTCEMLKLGIPARIRIPRALELTLAGERLIVYSDIDINEHMNNTNYPDMLCDFLPDMQGRRVVSLIINFLSEAALGETIKVYSAEEDGVYYFRTVRENGSVGIEAELVVDEV